MLQRPNAVGLILCEQVVIEEKTRNVTLVNSVSRLWCKEFPSPPQRINAFAVLTDGMGEATMSLIVYRLDTLEEVYERHWTMNFTDPLRAIRLIVRMPNVSFVVPGPYQFSLLANGEWVAQSVIPVMPEEESS